MPDILQTQIDQSRQTIHAEGYPMSVGELINLYKDGDLYLRPAFQRFFRWTVEQKSRLVESLLLGIPIPSIFVSQREDGAWDVIDGLQRLSTIFEFVGVLKDNNGSLVPPLALVGTKYLPAIGGVVWDNGQDNGLSEPQQRLIKRSYLDIKILRRESTSATKYELFQRLNTGGTPLSEQEVRSCIVIMERPDDFATFSAFADEDNFMRLAALTDRALEERYDLELVTRWIVLRRVSPVEAARINDLSTFLTDKILELLSDREFDLNSELALFREVMNRLADCFEGEAIFRKYDSQKKRFSGGFSVAAYEVLAIGLARNDIALSNIADDVIKEAAEGMWDQNRLGGAVGMGVRASSRLGLTLAYADRTFS